MRSTTATPSRSVRSAGSGNRAAARQGEAFQHRVPGQAEEIDTRQRLVERVLVSLHDSPVSVIVRFAVRE